MQNQGYAKSDGGMIYSTLCHVLSKTDLGKTAFLSIHAAVVGSKS